MAGVLRIRRVVAAFDGRWLPLPASRLSSSASSISQPPPPPPRQLCVPSWVVSQLRPCPTNKTAVPSPPPTPPPRQPFALPGLLRSRSPSKAAVPSRPLSPPPPLPSTPTARLPLLRRQSLWMKKGSPWPALPYPASAWRLLRRFHGTGAAGFCGVNQPGSPNVHLPVHKESSRLQGEQLSPIDDLCVDGGSFHLNFQPKDYLHFNPIMASVHVPGTVPPQFVVRGTDDGLLLMRSLPDILNTLHQSGYCLSPSTPLTLDNIGISSQGRFRIRLDRIKFIPLVNCEGGSISSDFKNCANVLEELLKLSNGSSILQQPQEDLKDLFRILRSCNVINAGHFASHHASLIPLRSLPAVFLKTYKAVEDLWNENVWVSVTVNNVVPLQYGSSMMNWLDIASAPGSGLLPWANYTNYARTKQGLLRFHRNCFCHEEMSAIDVNLLLHCEYPEVLSRLHEAFFKEKILDRLKLEENFNEKKVFYD